MAWDIALRCYYGTGLVIMRWVRYFNLVLLVKVSLFRLISIADNFLLRCGWAGNCINCLKVGRLVNLAATLLRGGEIINNCVVQMPQAITIDSFHQPVWQV